MTQLSNPTAGSSPRLQCHQARFHSFGFQDSTVAGFQDCKVADVGVPRFQSRLLHYQGSRAPSFQGPRFQASRLRTCKGLGLIHQQRNDQRNAKQTQNTIELLPFAGIKEHNVGSMALQFHKVKGSKFFTGFSVSRQGNKALDLSDFPAQVPAGSAECQQGSSNVPMTQQSS